MGSAVLSSKNPSSCDSTSALEMDLNFVCASAQLKPLLLLLLLLLLERF